MKQKTEWYESKKDYISYRQVGQPFSNIFVGSSPLNGMTLDTAAEFDIFINLTEKPLYSLDDKRPRQDTEYFWIPIKEFRKSWGFEPFYRTKKVLDEGYADGKKIYLHCHHGTNRSPTIAISWLYSQNMDFDEAVKIFSYSDPKNTDKFFKLYLRNYKTGKIPERITDFYAIMDSEKNLLLEDILKKLEEPRLYKKSDRKIRK